MVVFTFAANCLPPRPAICDAHAPLRGRTTLRVWLAPALKVSAVKPGLGLPCASRPAVCDAHAPLTGSNHPAGMVSFFVDTKKAGLTSQSRESCVCHHFLLQSNKNGSGTWIRTKDQVVNS